LPINSTSTSVTPPTGDGHRNNLEPPILDTQKQSSFVAVKRKKIVSIHVGNIDPDVQESDLYEYLLDNKVKPSNISMYYGRYGSSARVNVFHTDVDAVMSSDFWPAEITYRKWVNKTAWESAYGSSRTERRNSKKQTHFEDRDDPDQHETNYYRTYTKPNETYKRSYDKWYRTRDSYESRDKTDERYRHSGWGNDYEENWNDDINNWVHS